MRLRQLIDVAGHSFRLPERQVGPLETKQD